LLKALVLASAAPRRKGRAAFCGARSRSPRWRAC